MNVRFGAEYKLVAVFNDLVAFGHQLVIPDTIRNIIASRNAVAFTNLCKSYKAYAQCCAVYHVSLLFNDYSPMLLAREPLTPLSLLLPSPRDPSPPNSCG